MSAFEDKMDELLEEQARQCAKEQESAKGILQKFSDYIRSARFKFKCKKISIKTGVNYKIIQNTFVENVLGKIANILGMTINIVGDVIQYAVSFIASVISNVVYFANNLLLRVVDIVTLHCGSIEI